MTQRERQILNWIEENPMISQQELADKAGITRSSVAVHISNLMKKGCITGKGYIVHTAPYVTVVGGVNVDIGGQPSHDLIPQDSNPGTVGMSLGGVGRNIAHNMSLMGLDVRLVTAFGDDLNAQKIAASCGELGIDISRSPIIPGGLPADVHSHAPHHGHVRRGVDDVALAGDVALFHQVGDVHRHGGPGDARLIRQLLLGDEGIFLDPVQKLPFPLGHGPASVLSKSLLV